MVPRGNGVGFLGLGTFLPDHIRTNDWWPADWRERQNARLVQDMMASVDEAAARGAAEVDPEIVRYAGPYFTDLFRGIRERRVMASDSMPSDMEAAACRDAMANAGVQPHEIDAIFGYSLLPDCVGVENAPLVAKKIGLRRDVSSLAVTAACASWLHQLRVASSLVLAGECDKVLIFVSTATSPINDYGAPSSVVPGDGAVAAVIGRVEDGLGYIATTTSTHGEHHRAIMLLPRDGAIEDPWWLARGGEFVMRRGDQASGHFAGSRAASVCRPTVQRVLEKAGARIEDVAFMAVSQASGWFGRALADAVGIDHSRILEPEHQFERYGHLMAGSLALNVVIASRMGRLRKGDLVLMYSPGLGFVTAATLIRWNLGS